MLENIHAGGIDLVDLARFGRAAAHCDPAWTNRIAHEEERTGTLSVAEIFGLKESVIKILGGRPPGSGCHDIRVGDRAEDGTVPIRLVDALAGRMPGADLVGASAPE